MGPSNNDNGRPDDPQEAQPDSGGRGVDSGTDQDLDGDLAHDDGLADDDDGLAPEAGGRSPSVLSLLLLVAGAIWIVVALLKIGDRQGDTEAPSAALSEQAQTSAELPDIEHRGTLSGEVLEPADPQPADEAGAATGGIDDPELGQETGEGDPAAPRGPPEGSLLAGKIWPRDFAAPDVVHYTIKRGGSMKVVANLYKIFHHEMETLNPGVSLERELPPSTRLVVYRRPPGQRSESVNFAGAGSVTAAMPMVDGPGRILKHTPWKGWATTTTVATLDLVLREWARRFPGRQPILVGNMSARNGGRLKPHSSHQSGRDVDLSYPQIWDKKEELNWRKMDARNLDRELTWSLLELLRESRSIEVIFIDSKLQKLLYDYARQTDRHSDSALSEWMEYPEPPGSGSPLIRHVRGHDDHIHVRFKCTKAEAQCKNRER